MERFDETRRRQHELERLMEAISAGTIADVDDLDEAETALLRRAFPADDDLQKVFERIRGVEREER